MVPGLEVAVAVLGIWRRPSEAVTKCRVCAAPDWIEHEQASFCLRPLARTIGCDSGSALATFRPSAAARHLSSRPALNLLAQPQLRPTATEIDNRTRHVPIPVLVDAHRAGMREAEEVATSRASTRSSVRTVGDIDLRLLACVDPSDGLDSLKVQTK